jgi:hypothetical protein
MQIAFLSFFFCAFLFLPTVAKRIDFGFSEAYSSDPNRPNFYSLHHQANHERGDGYTQLDYDVEVIDDLINLRTVKGLTKFICSPNDMLLSFSEGEIPDFAIGTTLVGSSDFGCIDETGKIAPFYREIQEISFRGSDIILATKNKKLLECFRFAKINFHHKPKNSNKRIDYFGPASGMSDITLFSWNYDSQTQSASKPLSIFTSGKQIGPGNFEVSVTCDSCYAEVDASIDWELYVDSNWGFPSINHFKLQVSGNAQVNVDASASVSYAFDLAKQITILPQTDLTSFVIPVGPVDVEITPAIEMDAKIEMSLNAKGMANAGFSYQKSISAGLEYRKEWGEFRTIPVDTTSDFTVHQPTFTIGANSDIKVTLLPKLILEIYQVVPFFVELEPYIGSQLAIGSGSGCSSLSDLHYQLYGGLDLEIGLDPIGFSIFGIAHVSLGKSVGLPLSTSLTLIGQEDLSCSFCSGCLSLSKRAISSYRWSTSEWSNCSVPCGGGTKTRQVQCFQGDIIVDDSKCDGLSKPSLFESCNNHNCPNCSSYIDCQACHQDPYCHWCADSCMLQTSKMCIISPTPFGKCPTKEPAIVLYSSVEGMSFYDSDILFLNWTGGSNYVFIVFRWNSSVPWHSVAPNSDYLPNSGSFSFYWTDGIPQSITYQLAIVSSSDPQNFFLVDGFTMNPNTSTNTFWGHAEWGNCSKLCGTGSQARVMYCYHRSGAKLDFEACGTLPEARTRPCQYPFSCRHFPFHFDLKLGTEVSKHSTFEINWTGGMYQDNVTLGYSKFGSNAFYPIVDSTENNDTFQWDPSSLQDGQYNLQITSLTDDTNVANSPMFVITSQKQSSSSSLVVCYLALFFILTFLVL